MLRKGAPANIGIRILHGAAWFVLGLCVLVVLVFLGARLYLDEERLTELVPEKLGALLAGRLSAESIRWDLPLSIAIRGLVVHDPEGIEVLEVGSLEASVVVSRLFTGTVLIEPVRVSSASVSLLPPPEGAAPTRGPFTLIDAFMPKTPSPPSPKSEDGGGLTIRVGQADFTGVSVFADLEPWKVTADGLALASGELEIAPETFTARGGLRVAKLMARNATSQPSEIGPIRVGLEGAEYVLDSGSGSSALAIERLGVDLPGASLSASAQLRGVPAELEGQLELRARARLADPGIAALLPAAVRPWRLEGEPELRARFEGSIARGALEVELGGATFGAFGRKPVEVVLDARTQEDRLMVEPFRVSFSQGASVEATAAVDGVPALLAGQLPFERAALAHRARVAVRRLPVRVLGGAFTDPSVLPEALTATITAEGPSLQPLDSKLELRADVAGLPAAVTRGLVRRLGVALEAELARDHARVSSLRAEGDGLSVDLAGRVPFHPGGDLDAHLRVEHRDPGPALAQLGVPVQVDRVELEAVARGPLTDLTASGSFAIEGIRADEVPSARFFGDLRWNRGTLVVDRARLDATVGQAVIDARIGLLDAEGRALASPEIFADARLSRIPLDLVTRGQVRGELSASAQFLGSPERYDLRALVDAGSLEVQGATVAYTAIRLEGDHRAMVLSPMRVLPPGGGALEAEGRVDLTGQRFQAQARIIEVPAAVAQAFAPDAPDLAGVLSGRIRAAGAFARPAATATVALQGFALDGEPIGNIRLEAATEGSSVAASLELEGAAGRLSARGNYLLDGGELDVRVRGAELVIGSLPGIATAGTDVGGRLGIDLYARGRLPEPNVFGSIGVRGLELDGESVANGRLEVRVATPEPARYRLELKAFDVLTASATVTPSTGGALPVEGSATLDLEGLDLAQILPSLEAAGLAARVTAHADVDLGRGVPVRGRLTIPSFVASFGRENLSTVEPAVLSYDGKVARIEALTLEGPSGRFRATGQVGDTLDLAAQGDLQLAFVQPFVPAISQATGRVRLDARATGALDAPALSGELSLIEPGTIRLRGGLREVALDALSLSLSPARARIGGLRGRIGGGRFSVSGDVGLEGLTPKRWNVDFDAESIPFRSEDVLIEGDAHLRARGAGRVPRLEGDLAIVRGRYTKKFRLQDFVFVAREPGEEDGLEEPPAPWMSELLLDLHAKSVGAVDVKVDAQVLAMDVALSADLFIRGSAASPRIEGRVSTEEGTVRFPATELQVTTANIDFVPTPASGIRPLVDITATGEVTQRVPEGAGSRNETYDVTMHIKGPPDAMQLELSSTPALDQDQVLSLVILGRLDPTTLFAGNRGGPQQSRVTSSLVFAGSQLAAPVTNLVERALDQALNLDLDLGAEVSSESVRITAARELTSRFRIEGGWERSLVDAGTATSGSALLFVSNSLFFEGTAQTVSGISASSARAFEQGTYGTLELKLRVMGN